MLNWLISRFSVFAWLDNSLEIVALFSAAAEFSCITLETSLIRPSTEAIISACWTLASEISSISVLID